jgi:hypothetical protein
MTNVGTYYSDDDLDLEDWFANSGKWISHGMFWNIICKILFPFVLFFI